MSHLFVFVREKKQMFLSKLLFSVDEEIIEGSNSILLKTCKTSHLVYLVKLTRTCLRLLISFSNSFSYGAEDAGS